MRKTLILLASLILTFSLVACNTQKKPEENTLEKVETQTIQDVEMQTVPEAETQTLEKEEMQEATSTNLPLYEYQGDNSYIDAIAEYTTTELTKGYDKADVSIPSITVIETDESDSKDIKVWGIFEIYNYNLKEDTLECQSGGVDAGLMHISKDESGKYNVDSFDKVEDGSDFEPSAKKIFGKYYDAYSKQYADDKERENTREEFIKEYIQSNQLNINQYKDFGWDPVKIK